MTNCTIDALIHIIWNTTKSTRKHDILKRYLEVGGSRETALAQLSREKRESSYLQTVLADCIWI